MKNNVCTFQSDSTLWRRQITNRFYNSPFIVFIVLSMHIVFLNSGRATPFIQAMAKENIFFGRCFCVLLSGPAATGVLPPSLLFFRLAQPARWPGGTGRGEPGAGLPTTHSLWLRLRMGLNVTSSWWVNPFAKVLWSAIQWPNDCSWTEQWSLIRFIVSSYFWANKVPQLKARWFSYFSAK